MSIRNYFFIAALLLIQACKSSDNGIYEFDPRTIKGDKFTLSEIADDISYIPLDNTFPLNRIMKKVVTKDAIYLSSVYIGILRYDREGRFINKIGSIGRGPGEYIFSIFFSVDEKTGKLYNISDNNELIQVFTKEGKLIRNFKLKDYGTSINGILFYNSNLFMQCAIEYNDADYEWIICDTLGNIIRKQNRHLPKFTVNYGGWREPYLFKDKLIYFNEWTDTIFSVLPDFTEKPLMIIIPGEHRIPRTYVPTEDFLNRKYFGIPRLFETNRFFFINYYTRIEQYIALIDKHTRKAFLSQYKWSEDLKIGGIMNDLDSGSRFLPDDYFTENGREFLVGLQYPYQIKTYVASDEFKNSIPKYPEKKKELEKLANSLKETDNPVLMIVRLKK